MVTLRFCGSFRFLREAARQAAGREAARRRGAKAGPPGARDARTAREETMMMMPPPKPPPGRWPPQCPGSRTNWCYTSEGSSDDCDASSFSDAIDTGGAEGARDARGGGRTAGTWTGLLEGGGVDRDGAAALRRRSVTSVSGAGARSRSVFCFSA